VGFSDFGAQEPAEKAQSYYTGGSKSGVLVQDPQKKDLADQVIDNAKRTAGALSSSPSGGPLPSRRLVFWRQGFTVDDSELRRYDDPANSEFLEAINRGVAPPELAQRGQEIDLNIEDRKEEEYKPPALVLRPFSGAGHSLGGGTATTVVAVPPRKQRPPLVVDSSVPTTSLQIRLHDGTRLVVKFNHHHTVGDIIGFVDKALPEKFSYQLQTAFPVKVLTDEGQTIAEAGLLNAVLLQKKL